ncbi:DUF2971 domain-containing protein [Aeromonas sp. 601027]|uniref:DUF2971 domain-containing protein n=1 Tax=Aeromonas sp. 601027 TaxID=2712036 RepID=UPI003B9E9D00
MNFKYPEALDAALGIVRDDISSERVKIRGQLPYQLFHYTNTTGLIGILESSRIWATHFSYLNDASEFSYGISLLEEIVNTKIQSTQDPIIVSFLKRTLDRVKNLNGSLEYYISCFCARDDLLSQWRGYTDAGGGFAIGFYATSFDIPKPARDASNNFMVRKVIYEDTEQRRLLEEVIDKTIAVLLDITNGFTQDNAHGSIIACCKFASDEVAEYLTYFKHPVFEAEHEWRLLHMPHDDTGIKFRNGPYGITPYVCLDLRPMAGVHTSILPIESVRHGPTTNAKNTQYSLRKLLNMRSYSQVEIHGTELPIRV